MFTSIALSGKKISLSKKETSFVVIGALFCLAGVLSNELIAGTFITENWYEVMPWRVRTALWIINISLVIWGSATIIFHKNPLIINSNITLITLFVITPLAGEMFIRSAISLNVEFFRNPRLYAGWLDDDDQWKLRHQWGLTEHQLEGGGFVPDPMLGWVPEKTAQNPLGILSEQPYMPDFRAKTVLFYGDSYVYGMAPTPINQRVPQQLDNLLADSTVYNYGVVGYGLDQTYLRFAQTHQAFEQPFIIIGVYTLDLDRSILRVREMPKPYFEIHQGRLDLQGIPVPKNMDAWLEQHPVTIKSYLLAFLTRQFRIMSGGFEITEIPYRQTEKKQLNEKIIETIVHQAENRNLPLLFVIFHPQWEFGYTGWRETYLQATFNRLEVPYIDTKQLFVEQAGLNSAGISQFYDPNHGHLNGMGGKIVADAIAAYVKQYEGYHKK